MKKISILALIAGGMLLAGAECADAQGLKSVRKIESPTVKTTIFDFYKSPTSGLFLKKGIEFPQKATEYKYDDKTGKFKDHMGYVCKYDKDNRILEMERTDLQDPRYINKYIYEYDDSNGEIHWLNLLSQDKGKTWKNREKQDTYMFPNGLTKGIVNYKWNHKTSKWEVNPALSFYIVPEKDDNGRVTKITRYNDDTKTTKLKEMYLYFDNTEYPSIIRYHSYYDEENYELKYLTSIRWYTCNNDFTYFADVSDIIFEDDKDNRLKSYIINNARDDGNFDMANIINIEYDDKDRLTKITNVDGGIHCEKTITYPDELGSFVFQQLDFLDLDENGVFDECDMYIVNQKMTTTFDEHGNVLQRDDESCDETGVKLPGKSVRNICTYDDEGRLVMCEMQYKDEAKDPLKYVTNKKIEFSDFTTNVPTSIEDAAQTDTDILIIGNELKIRNANGKSYSVCGVDGRILMSGIADSGTISIAGISNGIYIVNVEGKSFKFLKK